MPIKNPEVLVVAPNSYDSVSIDYLRGKRSSTHALPPLGTLCVATAFEKAGFRTQVLDAERDLLKDHEVVERISRAIPDGGYVGWTTWIITMDKTARMIAKLQEERPDLRQFIGGPHMSAVPVRTMQKFPFIPYGVVGEAELSAVDLVKNWGNQDYLSKTPGIIVRDGNRLRFAPDTKRGYTRPPDKRLALMNLGRDIDEAEVQDVLDQESKSAKSIFWPKHSNRVEDIDDLPIPRYTMLGDLSPYHLSEFTVPVGEKQLSVISSRGCAYACSFCDQEVSGHTIRALSPKRAIEHMRYIRDLDVDYLYFTDDLRLVNFDYEEQMAKMILETPQLNSVTWEAITRANLAARAAKQIISYKGRSMNLLELMNQAGCRQLHIAPETGNEELRYQALFKRITNQEIIDSVKATSRAGIRVKTLNMVGLPGETPELTLETLEFLKRLGDEGAAYAMIAICTPLPTTPLALMIENGLIKWTGDLDDWEKMNLGGAAGIFTTDIRGNEVDYTPEHMLLAARGKHRLGSYATKEDRLKGETIDYKIAQFKKLMDGYRAA